MQPIRAGKRRVRSEVSRRRKFYEGLHPGYWVSTRRLNPSGLTTSLLAKGERDDGFVVASRIVCGQGQVVEDTCHCADSVGGGGLGLT